MDKLIAPALGDQIIDTGIASEQFNTWLADITEAVNNLKPLAGSGSPEAAEVASVGRWYVDTNASPAAIYYKATGDGNTGWVITS